MGEDRPTSEALNDEGGPRGLLSAISTEMVRIYKDQFGRGPTRVRSEWAGPEIIIVTLEETFTPAERSLRKMGEHQRLRDLRLLFQYAEIRKFCEPVERITGRTVRGFFSSVDTEIDAACETFLLHPAGYEGPSRALAGEGGPAY